uniref:hypothetical protein n=1 Tax=Candidatus Electronema sp. TaxID=2698783 RepID=UPI0040576644
MPEEEDEGGYFYQPPVRRPYQILLEQLQACGTQDERERLLMRFSISQLPEPLRAAVQAAAVPRFFDRAFLNALLDQPLNEAQFAELTGLSYIEPYPGEGRFNVHERSRKLLQEKLWQEDDALYREISRRAFAHCVKQDQNDTTWRIETVYHQLIVEPDEGINKFNYIITEWKESYKSYAESLLRTVWKQHPDILIACLRILGGEAKEDARRLLKESQNPTVLTACLNILGGEAKEDARRLLKETQHPAVLAVCLNILGAEAEEDAKRLLKENQNPTVLTTCLKILSAEAKEEARCLLKESHNQTVLAVCLRILGDEAKEDARRLLKETQHPAVQAACLNILGAEAKKEVRRMLAAEGSGHAPARAALP